jgi:hypothetical protein
MYKNTTSEKNLSPGEGKLSPRYNQQISGDTLSRLWFVLEQEIFLLKDTLVIIFCSCN